MIISASGSMARSFISKIRDLSLSGKMMWAEKEIPPSPGGAVIRIGHPENPEYMDIDEGFYTRIPDYSICLYRAGTKYVMHIDSRCHRRQQMVGEIDGASFNQDLSVIFRRAKGKLRPVGTGNRVSIDCLRNSLDRFFVSN